MFRAIPINIPEIEKLIPKFMWKCKRLRIATTILKKRNKVGNSHF